jgi:signal transduction histidine kinase
MCQSLAPHHKPLRAHLEARNPSPARVRDALEQHLQFERLISDLLAAFSESSGVEVEQLIDEWVSRLGLFLGADQAAFYQFREHDAAFHRAHAWSREGMHPLPESIEPNSFFGPRSADQILKRQTIQCPTLYALHPDERNAYRESRIRSAIAVPFQAGPGGYLVFCTVRRRRKWPSDVLHRLQVIAGVFANAVARRQGARVVERLAGRIIKAQEDERRRIGRELHDHISQRLALLGISVDQSQARFGATDASIHDQLDTIRQRVTDIGDDIQHLSHRLHPSTLEYLGLLPALRRLVSEVADLHGLTVSLTDERVPPLDPDVALCLFRIAEESLSNVVKHSGARSATIHVAGTSRGVRLLVEDTGNGFASTAPRARTGLGLVSMRERLGLIDGTVDIESADGRGTRVDAWVPLEVH